MLDSSGSIGDANFARMKTFVARIVTAVDVTTCHFRFGLMKFGSSAMIQFQLAAHNSSADVIAAIDAVGYTYGYTFTGGALRDVRERMFTPENGDRRGVRDVVVMVTDGLANVDPRGTLQV